MFSLADARNFACQEIAQPKPAGVLFLSDCFYHEKEKQDRCNDLKEEIHLFGLGEIKVKRLDMLQINLTM